jgi:hypothetical protein
MSAFPILVQCWCRIGARAREGRELTRLMERMAESWLNSSTAAKTGLSRTKERLVQAIFQIIPIPGRQGRSGLIAAAGIMGLILVFSFVELGGTREAARMVTATTIDGATAISGSAHEIQFEERFAIQLTDPISLEAAGLPSAQRTLPDDTSRQVSSGLVPLPRPRKHR